MEQTLVDCLLFVLYQITKSIKSIFWCFYENISWTLRWTVWIFWDPLFAFVTKDFYFLLLVSTLSFDKDFFMLFSLKLQKSNKLRNQKNIRNIFCAFYAFYSACRVICYLNNWLFLFAFFVLILRNSMSLLSLKALKPLHFVTVNCMRWRQPT